LQEKTASEKVTFNSTIYSLRQLNEQKAATVRSCEKTEGEQFPILLEKSCSNKKGREGGGGFNAPDLMILASLGMALVDSAVLMGNGKTPHTLHFIPPTRSE
jgi:hypothetical protein